MMAGDTTCRGPCEPKRPWVAIGEGVMDARENRPLAAFELAQIFVRPQVADAARAGEAQVFPLHADLRFRAIAHVEDAQVLVPGRGGIDYSAYLRHLAAWTDGRAQGGSGGAISHASAPPPAGNRPSPEEVEAWRKEAEAKRRTDEFRLYYTDYKTVGGIKLPHRIQRSIDGKATEEMVFDSYKVNGKIDADTFRPSK